MGARVARDLGYKVPDRQDIVLAWPAALHRSLPFVDVYDDVDAWGRTAANDVERWRGDSAAA